LFLAVALAATAAILAVSGGFRTTVGGLRVSARSPVPAAIAAVAVLAWWWHLARRERAIPSDLEAAWQAIERHATRLIGGVALIAAIVAATFATRSAAGADASGYLSQADLWANGPLPLHVDLMVALDTPELTGWITTPLGWRPSEGPCDMFCEGQQAPTYPPGLPLLMAAPHAIAGIDGANAVVIASSALAVWATGMMAGGVAGVLAAFLLAFSPVFLYQSLQPMSDVPVTAAWMLCFLLLRINKPHGRSLSIAAGIACAIAVLIRPNLAPLAIVPLWLARKRVAFAIPVAVAGVFLAWLQFFLYGSPIRSGYGSAEELFSIDNVGQNAQRYFSWLIATSPVLVVGFVGFIAARSQRSARALAAFAALVIVSYLVYAVFDEWSYVRFLLPAMAVLAVFAAVQLVSWIERAPVAWRAPVFVAVLLAVSALGLSRARSLDTFKLADQLRRVEQVATFLSGYSGERPVVISGEQSGAIRYYTMKPILRWEAATPEALQAAIAAVEREGYSTYIALDAWEEEPFKKKFATIAEVQLDWPAMIAAGMSHRTRLWRISDRARFTAGTQVPTVRMP
jgi:hypothetical protein